MFAMKDEKDLFVGDIVAAFTGCQFILESIA